MVRHIKFEDIYITFKIYFMYLWLDLVIVSFFHNGTYL